MLILGIYSGRLSTAACLLNICFVAT